MKKIVRTAVGLEEVGDFDDDAKTKAKAKKKAKAKAKKRHLAVVK